MKKTAHVLTRLPDAKKNKSQNTTFSGQLSSAPVPFTIFLRTRLWVLRSPFGGMVSRTRKQRPSKSNAGSVHSVREWPLIRRSGILPFPGRIVDDRLCPKFIFVVIGNRGRLRCMISRVGGGTDRFPRTAVARVYLRSQKYLDEYGGDLALHEAETLLVDS